MTEVTRVVIVNVQSLSQSQTSPRKAWEVKCTGEQDKDQWRPAELKVGSTTEFDGTRYQEIFFQLTGAPPLVGPHPALPTAASCVVSPDADVTGVIVKAAENEIRVDADYQTVVNGQYSYEFAAFETDGAPGALEDIPTDLDAESSDSTFEELDFDDLSNQQKREIPFEYVATPISGSKVLLKFPNGISITTKRWRVYRQIRYRVTRLRYQYPRSVSDAIKQALNQCIPPAMAAGVAAFLIGGPQACVYAFMSSLYTCAQKEATEAVKMGVTTGNEWGGKSRIA